MLVKMLEDAPGSPDGVTVNDYAGGETYDVTSDLAYVFVAQGFAELVEAPEVETPAPDEREHVELVITEDAPAPKRGRRSAAPEETK